MKTILVPTDFSPSAMMGAQAAMELAERTDATVCLFTKVPGSSEIPFGEIDLNNPKEGPSYLFDHFEAFLQEYPNNKVPIRLVYTHLHLVEGLATYTSLHDVYMIVMGSDGVSGLKYFTGSHAQKVANGLTCPVLVVKQPGTFSEVKKILFASDFRAEALGAFDKLIDFATFYGSHIHLLYIAHPDAEPVEEIIAKKRLKEFEDRCWRLPVFTTFKGDFNIPVGIDFYAREHDIDLIAMVSHGETFWQKLKKGGSISETIVGQSELPVMTFRAKPVKVSV